MRSPRKTGQIVALMVGRVLLKRPWLVFVLGVAIVAVGEWIEHWPYFTILDRHLARELFFYGFLVPLAVWALLMALSQAMHVEYHETLNRVKVETSRLEQQRIARDLHDRLSQNLGYLHFKLDQLSSSDQTTLADIQSIQDELERMRQIANHAYEQVRDTVGFLRHADTSNDLARALQQEVQTVLTRPNLNVTLKLPESLRPLCPLVEQTILDITHEALTNINRHADARHVTVYVTCDEHDAYLTIADDGQGFQPDVQMQVAGHYGLQIMRERAAEVGGRLEIKSTPGLGTQIQAQFPNTVVSYALLRTCNRLTCDHLLRCQNENSTG